MDLRRAPADPRLGAVLRGFEERRVAVGGAGLAWPVPARPHQMLIFHLGEPYRVAADGAPAQPMPAAAVVGPQTYGRAEVRLTGEVHVFTVLLQPAGLHRLLGLDMQGLVNADPAARDVLGAAEGPLADALRRAPDFAGRIAAVEAWTEARLEGRAGESPVARAARRLLARPGQDRIGALAAACGLSARQFQRRFAAEVGPAPKLYARTVRFERALRLRREGGRPWTEVVHAVGYFDQAHFIRDCHALAGRAPGTLAGDLENVFFPGG